MSKPYDSVFKDLLERDPAGWVALAFGSVQGSATIVEVVSPRSGRKHTLQYGMLRISLLDLSSLLARSLATLPLAALTDAAADRLPEVMRRMESA